MCQLLALTSSSPVSPDFLLQGFFLRGGKTGDHSDGWGIALFNQGHASVQTHQSAAHRCSQARLLLHKKPKATTVLAHIRKATSGHVLPCNTHPFTRNLWGETWVFAHNGDLKGFHPDVGSRYPVKGQTDSERAYCWMLEELSRCFPNKPPLSDLTERLKSLSQSISCHGSFNFLLSNGTLLIAHCSTELYWAQRQPPFGILRLVDSNLTVDLSKVTDSDEAMVILATKPITRGEVWYPMGKGELRVFISGQLKRVTPPDTVVRTTPNEWDNAWSTGSITVY